MKNHIVMMICTWLILSASCTREECDFAGSHEFVVPVNLSPAKTTYIIGDTINVTSIFSNVVYERKTEMDYTLNDFRFFPATFIRRIDTIGKIDDLSEFIFLIDSVYNYEIFSYSDGGRSMRGQYNYTNMEYSLEYKLVVQKPGLYRFSHSCNLVKLGDEQEFDGMCRRKGVNAVVELNGGAENNVDLLLESPNSDMQIIWNKQEKLFHQFGGFCFYVVE